MARNSTVTIGGVATTIGILLSAGSAHAVPSFARQTGFECTTCHVSWPELTSVGRTFKLGGYTLIKPVTSGERPILSFDKDADPPQIPLAVMAMGAVTHTANTNTAGTVPDDFPKNNAFALQQFSLFLAGRASEHVGGFIQWTYDGIAHHSSIDNVDLRVANRYTASGADVTYGLSLNNSPTMSDIYNTTPVWGFPFAGSAVAPAPSASTLIQEGLAQQVAGLTAYALWNKTLYAELGGYRTANKAFSVFRSGVDRSEAAVLDGTAPYWRLALQRDWDEGARSASVGIFGLTARKFPDSSAPFGRSDKFRDVGIDAQYQYITDTHRLTGQINYIRETQDLDGTFGAGGSTNPRNKLNSMTAKMSYYYALKYGLSLGYLRTKGDRDDGLYNTGEALNGSANGRPDSAAIVYELNWLPWRDRRFTLQYVSNLKFNGAKTNYDGFGRNAKNNDSLMVMAWFMF
jgi:hypothetical protein